MTTAMKPVSEKEVTVKLRLQEMLSRTFDDDPVNDDQDQDRERYDEDEGSFGG